MATKKQNREHLIRAERRVLNRVLDFFKDLRKGHLKHGWGGGLHTRAVRERGTNKGID